MRIRRSTLSPSLSPCSSSSSCFSSSSSPHSTISTHSLSSSSNSTSSYPSLSSTGRCQGLDLLVKAVYHVAGSVVGVPYIQRRVIRRRKPAVRFASFVTDLAKEEMENNDEEEGRVFESSLEVQKKKEIKKNKQKTRSWKQGDRRSRRSSKIEV